MRFEFEMRGYQGRAADYIVKYPMCAGFIDMGLGKTIIALTAVRDIKRIVENQKGKHAYAFKWLVIAPIKVCETVWRQEAALWEHTRHLRFELVRGTVRERAYSLLRDADIYLINPELVPWLFQYLRGNWNTFRGLIVDESSLFKDHRSKRFTSLTNYGTKFMLKDPTTGKALRDAHGKGIMLPAHKFERTVILTGTPRPQSSMNLWSQIYILDHGTRLHKNFDTFLGRFFKRAGKITKHKDRLTENDDAKVEPDYSPHEGAPEKIHEYIADISVELNAEDMGILPPVMDAFHYVDLPTPLRAEYDRLEREAILELNDNPMIAVNGGAKTMMCWQYANGAIFDPIVDVSGQRTWTVLHDTLLDEMDSVLEQLDQNVLISYWFKHDRARLLARFKDSMAMPKKAEQAVLDWNEGLIEKLLMHPASDSHGLNLQFGGHNIAMFGMLWSNERYRQLIRRLARPGQPYPFVTVHHFMVRNTVHELQYASIKQKGDDEKSFRRALDIYQQARKLGLHVSDML